MPKGSLPGGRPAVPSLLPLLPSEGLPWKKGDAAAVDCPFAEGEKSPETPLLGVPTRSSTAPRSGSGIWDGGALVETEEMPVCTHKGTPGMLAGLVQFHHNQVGSWPYYESTQIQDTSRQAKQSRQATAITFCS